MLITLVDIGIEPTPLPTQIIYELDSCIYYMVYICSFMISYMIIIISVIGIFKIHELLHHTFQFSIHLLINDKLFTFHSYNLLCYLGSICTLYACSVPFHFLFWLLGVWYADVVIAYLCHFMERLMLLCLLCGLST